MLKINNGVSYNKRSLGYYRRFYILFPNVQIMNARVHNLSCLPIRRILSVSNPDVRLWYSETADSTYLVLSRNARIATSTRVACLHPDREL